MNKKMVKLVSVLVLMFPILLSTFATTSYAAKKDDEIKTVNVHLNKLVFQKGQKPTIENTGQVITNVEGEPLPGVTFKVFDVTNKYVEALKGNKSVDDITREIVAEADKSLADFGTEFTDQVKTDDMGVATFANLPIKNGKNYATYLFVETNSPAEISEKATPIVLSMPIYVPNTNDINQDVVVYPKNEKDTMITKDLSSDAKTELEVGVNSKLFNAEIGKPFGYSISALVPWNIADKEYYRITDTPDDGMKVITDTIKIDGLIKDTDYKVIPRNNGYVLELEINSEKVKGFAGKRFEIKYDAILTDTVEIDKGINNTAKIELGTTNEPDSPDTPEVTGPEVFTGGKKFQKIDDKSGKVLANAEFVLIKVSENKKEFASYTNGKYTWSTDKTDAKIYTSNDKGIFEIKGLEYSTKLPEGTSYAVEEIKSPDGYALLNEPVKFEVVKGEFDKTELPITNIKKGILPSTGGNGIYMFLVAGSVLMIGALVWYRRTQVETEI